jgi:hypothetical protein
LTTRTDQRASPTPPFTILRKEEPCAYTPQPQSSPSPASSPPCPHFSADKLKGSAPLKDFQTAGIKDKSHKHQSYDLFFETQGRSYTCRTDPDKSVNATDFVVGTTLR